MPEARDRLVRPEEDLMAIYARRRRSAGRGGFQIFEDGSGQSILPAPVRTPVTMRTPATVRNPSRVIGRENIPPAGWRRERGRGRGQGGRSVLPSWYPRTPLRDITSIVTAIERTRTRVRARAGEQLESIVPGDHTVADPSESTSGAQHEHNNSMITPRPIIRSTKYYPKSIGKVRKILLDITHENSCGDADYCLTPQRKLLNSIHTVEKAVMEELHKLKRTPSARKEERDKRVRILMSMR